MENNGGYKLLCVRRKEEPGFTTTSVVALPAAGIVLGVGLGGLGVKKVFFDGEKYS
ncbi:hypothetical protein [Nodularia chucula]|uniref:hypothetical protein n=1 Tax=Nodularia chucula TaxID=3093667 RepID=UPI0039C751C9